MRYGVQMARRAGSRKKGVLNTLPSNSSGRAAPQREPFDTKDFRANPRRRAAAG